MEVTFVEHFCVVDMDEEYLGWSFKRAFGWSCQSLETIIASVGHDDVGIGSWLFSV